MLRKVVAQPREGPALFEAEAFHLITGSFGRHAEKVDFIQSGDEGSAVANYRAAKVDRPQTLVGQKAENLTDVFFRGRDCGGVHGERNHDNSVLVCLVDLKTIKQRKELHRHDVFDVLGLQEAVISVILRL